MSNATSLPSIFWLNLPALGASSARPAEIKAVTKPMAAKAMQPAMQPQAMEPNRFLVKLRISEPCAEWIFQGLPAIARLGFSSDWRQTSVFEYYQKPHLKTKPIHPGFNQPNHPPVSLPLFRATSSQTAHPIGQKALSASYKYLQLLRQAPHCRLN